MRLTTFLRRVTLKLPNLTDTPIKGQIVMSDIPIEVLNAQGYFAHRRRPRKLARICYSFLIDVEHYNIRKHRVAIFNMKSYLISRNTWQWVSISMCILLSLNFATTAYGCDESTLFRSKKFFYAGQKFKMKDFEFNSNGTRAPAAFRGIQVLPDHTTAELIAGQQSNWIRYNNEGNPIHDLHEYTSLQKDDEALERSFWVSTTKSAEVAWYYGRGDSDAKSVILMMEPGRAGSRHSKGVDVDAIAANTGVAQEFSGNQEYAYWGEIPPEDIVGVFEKDPGSDWKLKWSSGFDITKKPADSSRTWESIGQQLRSSLNGWEAAGEPPEPTRGGVHGGFYSP